MTEEQSGKDRLRVIGIAIAALGGLLTITVIGAILGIPMMLIGVLLAVFAGRLASDEPDEDPEPEPAGEPAADSIDDESEFSARYDHYTDALQDVEELKRERRHDEAEELLEWTIQTAEAETHDEGYQAVPPAWYRHLAIVYRKEDRNEDEVAVLEQYMTVMDELNGSPDSDMVDRLERARTLAGTSA